MTKKAIVLGGTAPHAILIKNLKEQGYETILVDYLDHSVASSVADRHIQESTLDKEKVLAIARQEKPDIVISICIDQANVTACYVAEKLGLPHPYSYETALDVTQKGRMKEIMQNAGIPTAPFYLISKSETPSIRFPFPVVIKPTDSNSSKGVFKIETEEEFFSKFEKTLSYSREGKGIVEQYIDGTEIQVDCIAVNGKAYVLMVKDYIPMNYGKHEMNVTGYISPGPVCEANNSQISEIAQKIVDAFHLKTTAFFYQAKCNKSGIFVLELAARCAGGSAFAVVGHRCGQNYLDLATKAFLQETISVELNYNSQKMIGYFVYMKPGKFKKLDGVEQQIAVGNIHHVYMSAVQGMEVKNELISGGRIAVLVTLCDSYDEGFAKLKAALESISVLDDNGQDLSYWK